MEKLEYRVMYESENNHWWYAGLHDLVCRAVDGAVAVDSVPRLLDAGCGTGRLLELLNSSDAVGLDCSTAALDFCRNRRLVNLVCASVAAMPFSDQRFEIVVSLDVLYHRAVEDDAASLTELNRVLTHSGLLILNLPAYEFLRSSHDEAIHTQRRYTRSRLKQLLENAGFKIDAICYRNSILFPFATVSRLLKKIIRPGKSDPKSDLKPIYSLPNLILKKILLWENRLLLKNISLPWGLSLFVIARKTDRNIYGR